MPLLAYRILSASALCLCIVFSGCSSNQQEACKSDDSVAQAGLQTDSDKTTNPAKLTACFNPAEVREGHMADLRMSLELSNASDHSLEFHHHVLVPAQLILLGDSWWNGTVTPGQTVEHTVAVRALEPGTWGIEIDGGEYSTNVSLRVTAD